MGLAKKLPRLPRRTGTALIRRGIAYQGRRHWVSRRTTRPGNLETWPVASIQAARRWQDGERPRQTSPRLSSAPVRISFESSQFVELADQGIEFPHWVHRWVMPVVLIREEAGTPVSVEPLGTAFAIAGRLLVTATHVIEAAMANDAAAPGVSIAVFCISGEEVPGHTVPWGGMVPVQNVYFNHGHDIAVLALPDFEVPGASTRQAVVPLTAKSPKLGSQVIVLGYPGFKASLDGPSRIALDHRVTASQGTIEQLHIPMRDRVMVRFPALQSDFVSPSGMSGAPVVTEDGFVCGVVCSSTPPGDEGRWTSTASLLPLVFSQRITLGTGADARSWTIQELAREGHVPTDGSHEKVQITDRGYEIDVSWEA